MFANFTEETCTGTGATLALAGITTGNIPFSETFADGDLVAYVLEDSGGIIKIAGVGTYVSATDDITRNDTWNWNGTAVDDNPATNITLSGGTHTIRCDAIDKSFTGIGFNGVRNAASSGVHCAFLTSRPGSNYTLTANRLHLQPFFLSVAGDYDGVTFDVNTLVAASVARCGVYSINADGTVGSLLMETSNISTATTGIKAAASASAVYLPVGWYVVGLVSDGAIIVDAVNVTSGIPAISPLGTSNWYWESYSVNEAYENLGAWSALPDPIIATYAAKGQKMAIALVQS